MFLTDISLSWEKKFRDKHSSLFCRSVGNEDEEFDNPPPVYYVVEEPDSLHADRSPYDFEPADNEVSSLNFIICR